MFIADVSMHGNQGYSCLVAGASWLTHGACTLLANFTVGGSSLYFLVLFMFMFRGCKHQGALSAEPRLRGVFFLRGFPPLGLKGSLKEPVFSCFFKGKGGVLPFVTGFTKRRLRHFGMGRLEAWPRMVMRSMRFACCRGSNPRVSLA